MNHTWFDTLQEAVGASDPNAYASAQKWRTEAPETVPVDDQFQRYSLQRHKPTRGWTKSIVNNTYARQNHLDWFDTKTFYSIPNPAQPSNVVPVNPADVPNCVLRHHLRFAEPTAPIDMWPDDTLIGIYQVTYSVKFRGKRPTVWTYRAYLSYYI